MVTAIHRRKAAALLLNLMLSAWPAAGAVAQEVITLDEIVAKVNHEIITLSDIQRELKLLRSELAQEFRTADTLEREFQKRKKVLLRGMIENRMLLQKAEELGVTSNIDVEVAAYMEEMRKQAGIPNMDVLDQVLRQNGSSLAERREWVKKHMTIRALLDQFVYSKLTLLSTEIEAFYKENLRLFSEPAEVELAEILFLTEGKDKAQVRRKAEEAMAKLQANVPFEDCARQYSEGPTASRGGGIGTFKKGSMAPALEAVVFALNDGQISDIVETDYGFQIVKLIRKKAETAKPLAEVRPQIQMELYQRKAEPEMREFLEDLRSQSYIYVAPSYRTEYDVEGL